VWFDWNWDSNVWDLRDNTILMEWRRVCCYSMRDVSVLSSSTLLMESFQCWDCSTPTLQVWSNSSFSMKICWFVLFHSTIWTLSNSSNVPILLEYYWENHTKSNWECVIEWVIQFVLEVMWFYFPKVRDVEVMWVERFVMELFQVEMYNPIPTLEVKEVDKQLRSVCHFVSLYFWVRDEEMLTLSLRMEVDSIQNCLITKVFDVKLEIVSFNSLIPHPNNSRCWSFVNVYIRFDLLFKFGVNWTFTIIHVWIWLCNVVIEFTFTSCPYPINLKVWRYVNRRRTVDEWALFIHPSVIRVPIFSPFY
jgi:hypothetical protein